MAFPHLLHIYYSLATPYQIMLAPFILFFGWSALKEFVMDLPAFKHIIIDEGYDW